MLEVNFKSESGKVYFSDIYVGFMTRKYLYVRTDKISPLEKVPTYFKICKKDTNISENWCIFKNFDEYRKMVVNEGFLSDPRFQLLEDVHLIEETDAVEAWYRKWSSKLTA